jgi:hypothetical protein
MPKPRLAKSERLQRANVADPKPSPTNARKQLYISGSQAKQPQAVPKPSIAEPCEIEAAEKGQRANQADPKTKPTDAERKSIVPDQKQSGRKPDPNQVLRNRSGR